MQVLVQVSSSRNSSSSNNSSSSSSSHKAPCRWRRPTSTQSPAPPISQAPYTTPPPPPSYTPMQWGLIPTPTHTPQTPHSCSLCMPSTCMACKRTCPLPCRLHWEAPPCLCMRLKRTRTLNYLLLQRVLFQPQGQLVPKGCMHGHPCIY